MTREEIMGMEPSRELDALVADKVMTWHGFRDWYDDKDIYGFASGSFELKPVPHYSTDIAAAWEVVEKLNKKYDHVLFSGSDGKLYSQFVCCYDGDEETFEEYFAEAKTAPEAICKAALLAMLGGELV